MKFTKDILHSVILSLLLVGCTNISPTNSEIVEVSGSFGRVIEDPITQRYMISDSEITERDFQDNSSLPKQISIGSDPKSPFQCSEDSSSTLTDNLPLIDVSFIEADILDAILELSLLTGVSIITDDNIEGIVSVNFVGKTLDEVLAAIITPGNFGYKKYESFIFVGSQNPLSTSMHLLSTTCLYKPVFLRSKEVVELLNLNYQQYISYYEDHDHISIVAPDSIQRRIQHDISLIDKMPDQILLEMSIIEVSVKALDLLGVKWNGRIGLEGFASTRNSRNVYSLYNQQNTNNSLIRSIVDSFGALNTDEKMQIRAMPSIVTLNGKEAIFESTETVWLPIRGSGSSQQQLNITYGINLRITPFVSQQNQIRLEISQASVSDLVQDNASPPRVINHAISTSVLMHDGETLVLGGLLQKKRRNYDNNVPVASKIPFVGGLFRHTENNFEHTEVLIVIRPRILDI